MVFAFCFGFGIHRLLGMTMRIVLLLVLFAFSAAGQTFELGKRYFGVIHTGVTLVEFVFDSHLESENGYSGTVSWIGSGNNSRVRIKLVDKDGALWFVPNSVEPPIGPLQLIETVYGPAIGARTLYPPDPPDVVDSHFHPAIIWLDTTLESHPAVMPEPVIPESLEIGNSNIAAYTSQDGLVGNATRAIAQTPDGFIWVGTVDGMSRFDGYDWKTYGPKSEPPLPDQVVSDLAVGPDGRLIIGTKEAGVFYFDGHVFEPLRGGNDELTGKRIGGLTHDSDGSFWFTTDDGRSLHWHGPGGELRRWDLEDIAGIRHGPEHGVAYCHGMLSIGDGRVLLSTGYGLRIFDIRTGLTTYVTFRNGWPVMNGEGLGMAVADGRLFGFSEAFRIVNSVRTVGYFLTVCPSRQGGSWVVGNHGALGRLENGVLQRVVEPTGRHNGNDFGRAIEDIEGNLWIGRGSEGLLRVRAPVIENASSFMDIRSGARNVRADAGGKVHITLPISIASIDGDETTSFELNQALSETIPSLARFLPDGAERGRLPSGILVHNSLAVSPADLSEHWFGVSLWWKDDPVLVASLKLSSEERIPILARKRGGEVEFFFSDEFPVGVVDVYSVDVRRNGEVWCGTDQGVFVLRAGRLEYLNGGTDWPQFDAVTVMVDSKDRVLVGGYGAGVSVFADGGVRKAIGDKDGLASDTVVSLYEDSKGAIWIGTDAGLSRLVGDSLETFNGGADFLKGRISSIVEDIQGNLWFGTPNGIFAVRRAAFDEYQAGNLERLGALHFGTLDGMENENVMADYTPSAARAADGMLYFGMQEGLIRFDPAKLLATVVPPIVGITKCASVDETFYDQDAVPSKEEGAIVLRPEAQNVLMFDYSARTFSFPKETRYEYRLEGGADQWHQAGGQRSAMFTQLAPGDYKFEVRAINHNDAVSEVASFPFHLQPYYYQTWAFRLGVAGVLIGSAFMFYRWRLGYRDQIMALEQEVEMNDERSRIARDMHDEIGSSLGQMRLLGELARDLDTGNAESNRIARQIENLAVGCSKSLREIIWSLNPRKSGFGDLSEYIHELVERSFENTPIEPRVVISEEAAEVSFSPGFRRELVLILKGIMSNTIKHSRAAHFELSLGMEGATLNLKTADDGVGFDAAVIPVDSHGLQAIRERVGKLDGSVEFVTKPGAGTLIQIRLPLTNSKRS